MNKTVKEVFDEKEISLVELLSLLYLKKNIILLSMLIFFTIGIIWVTTAPVQYESKAITISESDGGRAGLGQLGGLAGLAGINIPQGGMEDQTFTPELYPDVVASRPFLMEIIQEEFFFRSKNKTMTLYEYFIEERPENAVKKTIGFIMSLPNRIVNFIWNSSVDTELTSTGEGFGQNQGNLEYVIGEIREKINIESKNKLIILTVKAPEPQIAAALNEIVLNNIIEFITEYKTGKQKVNVNFIEERAIEAESNFNIAQNRLASFRDANQGIISQRVRSREEQLLAEYNISFNTYNSLKQELEQGKIQLKKESPVFTLLEPPSIPLGKSDPKIFRILVIAIIFGLMFGLGLVSIFYMREYYR